MTTVGLVLFAAAPLATASAGLAFGQTAPVDPSTLTTITPRSTIFLTQIDDVKPGTGCNATTRGACLRVRFRVLQVLSDPAQQGLGSGPFDGLISGPARFTPPVGGAIAWSRQDVVSGQRYLVFSNGTGLPAMFESPTSMRKVTDDEDSVGDVELILATSGKSLRERASMVAEGIRHTRVPRTYSLAEYAEMLIAFGSEFDTEQLAQSITEMPPGTFSYGARQTLLSGLHRYLTVNKNPNDTALRVFVSAVSRFFVEVPDSPDASEPDERMPILQQYVPWIAGSVKARIALRSELSLKTAEQLIAKLDALGKGQRFPADQLERARQLVVETLAPR